MAHIAFIDADAAATASIAASLKALGHTISILDDGSEALEVVRHRRPDLLVLCVEIPHVSGYTLCNKLKRDPELAKLPLVLVSSVATAETFEEHKRLRTRADAYAHKPYQAEQLQQIVAHLLPPAESAAPNPAGTEAAHEPPDSVEPTVAPASASRRLSGRKTQGRAVRFGEDPSVHDISSAPFLQTGEPGEAGRAGHVDNSRRTTAPGGQTPSPALSTNAELLLEQAVDLGASTQVYSQNELVTRALGDLVDEHGGQAASSSERPTAALTQVEAEPSTSRPRRSKKPRRAAQNRETLELPTHPAMASLTQEVMRLEQERDHWRTAAEAAARQADGAAGELQQALGAATEHARQADHLRTQLLALEEQVLALTAQLTQQTEEKVAAELAATSLRQGLAALLTPQAAAP